MVFPRIRLNGWPPSVAPSVGAKTTKTKTNRDVSLIRQEGRHLAALFAWLVE